MPSGDVNGKDRVYVALLGGVRVRAGGVEIDSFPRRKVAALLACVALRPRQVHSRETVAGALWPDADTEEARHNLRQTLSLLRRQLAGAPWLMSDAQTLRLSADVQTDVEEFEAALRAGDADRARRLYRGELLPGFYEDWAEWERERLEALRESAGLDALTEHAPPPPQQSQSRLGAEYFPPAEAADCLPTFLSSFHGRAAETERLARWLRAPDDARLLTLVGPGGIGKTRLAVEAAGREISSPTCFVDLAALPPGADPDAVAAAAASALGSPPRDAATTPRDAVRARMRLQPGCLLLDNCEHVSAGAAVFAADVLTAAPSAAVLATSREPLRVPGERVLIVGPLSPEDAHSLFLDRARAAREDLPEDPESVTEICRRLDGLPLAIELAAARAGALTPQTIANRLSDRFNLLDSGSVSPLYPVRHRTLGAVLDWSFDLLSPDERRLLAYLSVFVGGWTLEASEAVCGCPPGRLVSLVDRSLVAAELASAEEESDSFRYRLLETVREYAAARLDEAEARQVCAKHADYYESLAAKGADNLHGPQQRLWLARLEAEHDNLRAAADYLTATAPERALRMTACLARFWQTRGYLAEGAARLEAVLQRASESTSGEGEAAAASWRAEALLGAADIAYLRGEHGRTEALYREALAVSGRGGNPKAAGALRGLGLTAMLRNDHTAARRLLKEAVAEAEAAGDDGMLSDVLASQAQAVLVSGADLGEAVAFGERAVRLARAAGDAGRELSGMNLLLWAVAARDGQLAAQPLLEEALPLARSLGARRVEASLLVNLAACTRDAGDFTGAEALFREGASLALVTGDQGVHFAALRNLCEMATVQGRTAEASAHLNALLIIAAPPADSEVVASMQFLRQALARAAALADAQGDAVLAVRLLAAARADQAPDRRWRPVLERLRGALSEETYQTLWAEGAALSPASAVALAGERLITGDFE